jgi:hypothetical protein
MTGTIVPAAVSAKGDVVMDGTSYPGSFSVDYPDRQLNRMTSFFRIFTVIPIAIVLGAVAGGTWQWTYSTGPPGQQRARAACCSPARCS